MPTRDYKTMVRLDPRLRAGLKRAAATRDYPLYLLTEKILWDWLAENEPRLAKICYDWKPPSPDDLKIRLPSGSVQTMHDLESAIMDWT